MQKTNNPEVMQAYFWASPMTHKLYPARIASKLLGKQKNTNKF